MTALALLTVDVLMRLERVEGPMSRWQPWRWTLDQVSLSPVGTLTDPAPRLLRSDEAGAQWWLHPGFAVELHRDDAEGYYLNVTTPAPAWFVLWRMQELPDLHNEPIARPEMVSLSYHDAGRWLDAQETVETAAAPADVVAWVQSFAEAHFVPEPKRRQRPQSFQRLTDRFGQPVSISTEGKRKGAARGEGS